MRVQHYDAQCSTRPHPNFIYIILKEIVLQYIVATTCHSPRFAFDSDDFPRRQCILSSLVHGVDVVAGRVRNAFAHHTPVRAPLLFGAESFALADGELHRFPRKGNERV
jgi:hypothetical protein